MKLNGMIVVYALLCTVTLGARAQSRIIAHRGYWKCEGSAQNSITSLQKAAEVGIYGSEFDVQLTKDRNVVVNHDDSINGMMIGDVTYGDLKNIRLKNGEKLSLLDDYLKVGKTLPGIQLILEIKPHRTEAEENDATDIVVRKVKEMNMEKQVEYISFSMNICERLVKLTPESEIAYLNGDISPENLKDKGINGIDYHVKILAERPEWIEEAHRLGMKVNVWTVDKMEQISQMNNLKVDFITTNYPVKAKNLVAR
ncbi:glycerophosphodiester phosphodiesterase family protein [Bacteroides helcogenes]|uniref:Glycerophosphoryl diester phosphodiesterase n=1 Tax=Bacteroides helcogenes (strain ATCC 35417 / DSM 20613 / JCM 6297 / CCUG 15421 / P 36-108) TaxID=693979 RepID=E6SUM9_BACT6|nr:glycerophosphodiester phosphodiesterase family protein [Bacteroides helcogenes]ADV43393.1 glycerophosphoryl diester phosphodiesterase [Bacteroides helcogenes P 36-108]MDY5238161.1 glycerophosphodiester phosphodiesterase family protein [Bacteroides helcogenes]